MNRQPIYLDYNATTPCDPRVVEHMLPYFTHRFGNPASADHLYGWAAREAVEEAREAVAALIGAAPKQITFTSGATESINLALKGLAAAHGNKGHIITCHTEHRAVLDTCAYLESTGIRVSRLDTGADGRVSAEQLEAAIAGDTICIALMYGNNETGVLHPVDEIGRIASRRQVPFFCDATQAAGKMPVDVNASGIDLMAFSAHKLYGPKGAGALYVRSRRSAALLPQQHGGHHEQGLRSGTLNTPCITGFGKAAQICREEMTAEGQRLRHLRDELEHALLKIPGVRVNGGKDRLPHVSNLLLPHPDAEKLLLSLSACLAMSRGSACTSGLIQQPSHVLKAMGLSDEQAARSVRISLGRFTTQEDIRLAAAYISQAILSIQPLTA
ncbi:cysteine desulfurase family protein [Chitinophaga sp. 22620]|uniref:cysteine desulfurase family protein n=1 Tax=Chitinophaga sp. 22620 TaxID=3453952 RepID=UPI003F87634A